MRETERGEREREGERDAERGDEGRSGKRTKERVGVREKA